MSTYVVLLHDNGSFPSDISPAEIQRIIQKYVAWRQKAQQGGRAVLGHKLRDGEGRVLRGAVGAPAVTDGPYAEAREVIGGLFIIDAASYEEAAELCKDCPHLEFGTVEIREVQPT